jgi:hypothetical protein
LKYSFSAKLKVISSKLIKPNQILKIEARENIKCKEQIILAKKITSKISVEKVLQVFVTLTNYLENPVKGFP